MNKKEFLEKLYISMGLCKVACVVFAALYCVFWFYRFFSGPYAENLAIVFDFFARAIPLPFETLMQDNRHTTDNAYFVAAVVLGAMVFVFHLLEDVVARLERRRDLEEIRQKRMLEEQMNKELERDYKNGILKYNYFSILIRYKAKYVNQIFASTSPIKPEDLIEGAYAQTAHLIKKAYKNIYVTQNPDYVFIKGEGFKDFDKLVSAILNAIKLIKIEAERKSIRMEFMIVFDAQEKESECNRSINRLLDISENNYYGKAMATIAFKTRFDLLQDKSVFMTDATGFSTYAMDNKNEEEELFMLKSKPKAI